MTRARYVPARPVKPPKNIVTPPVARNCDQVSAVAEVAMVAPNPTLRMATAAVSTHGPSA